MEYLKRMPKEMKVTAGRCGTVEHFEYDTYTYEEDNKPLHKEAWVYLPYGYNSERKYNILYLLHGGGVNHDWWFKMFPDTVTILDNMIEKGICEPCIIVTPTYYSGDDSDKNAEHITEHFCHELRKDLIPAIEKKYSTYADADVSEDNLVKTRDHRAIAGLSLGSMTTYRAGLYNNFDMFAWYGPFSGCGGPFGNRDNEVLRIKQALAEGESNGLELKYMFCCNGDKDIAYEEHIHIMDAALKECPQLISGENYDMFVIPGGIHDMNAWQLHLYHALQIFFK